MALDARRGPTAPAGADRGTAVRGKSCAARLACKDRVEPPIGCWPTDVFRAGAGAAARSALCLRMPTELANASTSPAVPGGEPADGGASRLKLSRDGCWANACAMPVADRSAPSDVSKRSKSDLILPSTSDARCACKWRISWCFATRCCALFWASMESDTQLSSLRMCSCSARRSALSHSNWHLSRSARPCWCTPLFCSTSNDGAMLGVAGNRSQRDDSNDAPAETPPEAGKRRARGALRVSEGLRTRFKPT
mmetsp:Transcript_61494/g.187841  ORF Transcript_61494/g.187841 Transcript_61494/m.187841 type:complete len:252 (-) Transcript_61494:70-825(-)